VYMMRILINIAGSDLVRLACSFTPGFRLPLAFGPQKDVTSLKFGPAKSALVNYSKKLPFGHVAFVNVTHYTSVT